MRYFKKALVSGNPFYFSNGRKAVWEDASGDNGLMATEDGWVIDQLVQAIRRGIGGVVELNAETYEEEKKKGSEHRSQVASASERLKSLRQKLTQKAVVAVEPPPMAPNPNKGGVGRLNPDAIKQSTVRSVGSIKVLV